VLFNKVKGKPVTACSPTVRDIKVINKDGFGWKDDAERVKKLATH